MARYRVYYDELVQQSVVVDAPNKDKAILIVKRNNYNNNRGQVIARNYTAIRNKDW